jgi:hypothetical protein
MARKFSLPSSIFLHLSSQFASYEFGGPWGVTAMMTGFPILMYYLWICLWFYDGKLAGPSSVDDIQPFFQRMWIHVRDVRLELFQTSNHRVLIQCKGRQPKSIRVESL